MRVESWWDEGKEEPRVDALYSFKRKTHFSVSVLEGENTGNKEIT